MRNTLLALVMAGLSGAVAAAPETYAVDNMHSAIRFGYDHLGLTYQQHRFNAMTGKIALDRESKTGSVDVTIDAKSINTGVPIFNEQLQGPSFFDTLKHPNIVFKSTKVKFDGDKPVSIDGELTIKGITKPVTLTVTSFFNGPHPIQKAKTAIGANAVAKLKRSDFDMTFQLPLVADDVSLSLTVQAFKE